MLSALPTRLSRYRAVGELRLLDRYRTLGLAGATALALLVASTLALQLGLATFVAALLTLAVVLLFKRELPWNIVRHIAWGVLPLVLPKVTSPEQELAFAIDWGKARGLVRPGQHVVLLRGQVAGEDRSRGALAREVS